MMAYLVRKKGLGWTQQSRIDAIFKLIDINAIFKLGEGDAIFKLGNIDGDGKIELQEYIKRMFPHYTKTLNKLQNPS